MTETKSEYQWEKMVPRLTALQSADFGVIVDGWLDGSVPLAQAAAALRARIAKLPANRPEGGTPTAPRARAAAKPKAAAPAKAPVAAEAEIADASGGTVVA